ncbi:GNAT family N-acetyltransferase [Actinomadura scrupuli]|uniref:GNAT family N-acetyltransferase n=1 Tax=Actinomadura scrupuli TaxID=559629 RepID=UPI003D99D850
MTTQFLVRRALIDHQEIIIRLIDEAGAWLRDEKGSTQWNRPWPTRGARDQRVRDGLLGGRTWIAWDGDVAAASVTIHLTGSPYLWTEEERRTPAIYLHRLVLNRAYAGMRLGARLIAWAGQRGFQENPEATCIRIDTWTDNHGLHKYYERQGFEFVGVRQAPGRHPSGRLFQKPIYQALVVDTSGLVHGREPAVRTVRRPRPHHGHGGGGRGPAIALHREVI